MKGKLLIIIVILLLLGLSFCLGGMPMGRHINIIKVEGVIDSTVSQFILSSISRSEEDGAECLIIQLDTPGGLLESTETIFKAMMNAKVPIVVYISPVGASAASAGTFITQAADVAVMAPGTTIGAAHPVDIQGKKVSDKIAKYAAAKLRSIAGDRKRNIKWVEEAVMHSAAISEKEALKLGVIDFTAKSLPELVNKLDGRKVVKTNITKIIQTKNAETVPLKMNPFQRFLHTLINPNIAYILFLLGINGLLYEFVHPGAIFPGVTGVICLLLAFYSLAILPVNLAGLLLILVGIVLMILEAKTPGFGAFGIGGIVALLFGSFMLFSFQVPTIRVSPILIFAVVGATFAMFLIFVPSIIVAYKRKVATGPEVLPGVTAQAKTDLTPSGIVFYMGEDWSAEAVEGEVKAGESVKVLSVEGLRLKVEKLKK